MARLGVPMGGRVRKSRAVGDQTARPLGENVGKLGGTISECSLDARGEEQFGDSLGREGVIAQRRKWKVLTWTGTSWEIDCESIGGLGG